VETRLVERSTVWRVRSSRSSFPGGKSYLASKIIALFPPRDQYTTLVETHAGGCAVTLSHDPEGKSEVVNDLDGYVSNFWRVLADPEAFERFRRAAEATPFSEKAYRAARNTLAGGDVSERETMPTIAHLWFLTVRQSLAGYGRSFAPVSTSRVRRGMNEQVSAWLTAVDGLPEVHARVRRWLVLGRDGTAVVRQFDKPGVVLYVDPPYPHGTRESKAAYRNEMTDEAHAGLLEALAGLSHARALVSTYPNRAYQKAFKGWRKVTFAIDNKASTKREKDPETEVVYLNY
jgi:DNA adenine methylase